MPQGRKSNTLEQWEVALVKTMCQRGYDVDQDILAFFTRPTRSVNHRLIGQIRKEEVHKAVSPASNEQLDSYLEVWPNLDPETGLALRGDELLLKAREAMVAAVHIFNSAGLRFRSELFIVTAVIAWTYLLHSWYKRRGIDYRHKDERNNVLKTKEGADKYWELSRCLKHEDCPISKDQRNNLFFLLELRHEIEHRSTDPILDDVIGAKLQACCLNFNRFITEEFGSRYGLEKRLPMALQFVSFDVDQKIALKAADDLPKNISTMIANYEADLTDEQLESEEFAYRVLFIKRTANRESKADVAIQFLSPESEEAKAIKNVFLKPVEKRRYTATKIINQMRDEGFSKFTMACHTKLWKSLDAKNPNKAYGKRGDYSSHWVWYESWVNVVREHCSKNRETYS